MDTSQDIGLVDLETLIKIYEQLVQSHYEEDNELARFIRDKYLPDEFNDDTRGGVQIQGKESFTKLYNAYKRVRNLTGRVQDKWPFFDRKWKTINKNVVIKIAAGEENPTLPDATGTSGGGSSKSLPDSSGVEKNLPSNGTEAGKFMTKESSSSSHIAAAGQLDESTINEAVLAQEPHAQKDHGKLSPSLSALIVPSSVTPPRSSKSGTHENDTFASSSPGSVLAAEALSERSSLDKFTMKRKSSVESDISAPSAGKSRGTNKRQRGTGKAERARGGKTRSSRVERTGLNGDENDHTPSTFEDLAPHQGASTQLAEPHIDKPSPAQKSTIAPPSPRVTRQKKRISEVSDIRSADRRDSIAGVHPLGVFRKTSPRRGAQLKQSKSSSTNRATPGKESTTTDLTETTLVNFAMSQSPSRQQSPATDSEKADRSIDSANLRTAAHALEAELNSTKKEAGTVEIFARVSTQTGVHEIQLPSSVVDDKGLEKALLGYATWKEKMGDKKSVDFETWRSINGFDW